MLWGVGVCDCVHAYPPVSHMYICIMCVYMYVCMYCVVGVFEQAGVCGCVFDVWVCVCILTWLSDQCIYCMHVFVCVCVYMCIHGSRARNMCV
jgi:hypothetical protein